MNENVKKGLLITVCAVFLIVAVVEGISFTRGPQLKAAYEMGHGTPGHSAKMADKAALKAAQANQGNANPAGEKDPLAGGG